MKESNTAVNGRRCRAMRWGMYSWSIVEDLDEVGRAWLDRCAATCSMD